jgi:hypothetical protein
VRAAGAVRLTVPEAGWLRSKSSIAVRAPELESWALSEHWWSSGLNALRPGLPDALYSAQVSSMYHHVKKLMYTVRVDEPDPKLGNMVLEQFGGANGKPEAAISTRALIATIRGARLADGYRDRGVALGSFPSGSFHARRFPFFARFTSALPLPSTLLFGGAGLPGRAFLFHDTFLGGLACR